MPILAARTKIRLPRITPRRIANACEQLGDAVSVRNVHRMLGGSFRDIGPMVEHWRKSQSATPGTANPGAFTPAPTQGAALDALAKQIHEAIVQLPRNTDTRLREQSDRLGRIETALAKPAEVINIQRALRPLSVRIGSVEDAIRAIVDLAPAVEGVHRMLSDLNTTMLELTKRLREIGDGNTSAPTADIAEPLRAIAIQLHGLPTNLAAIITAQAQRTTRQLQRQHVTAQAAIDAQLARLEKHMAPKRAKPKTKKPVRKTRRPTRNSGGKAAKAPAKQTSRRKTRTPTRRKKNHTRTK